MNEEYFNSNIEITWINLKFLRKNITRCCFRKPVSQTSRPLEGAVAHAKVGKGVKSFFDLQVT